MNVKGIKGVSCPSKYYDIAAAGKALIAVLEEKFQIRCIIEETSGGLCAKPCDYSAIEKNINWFINHANCTELKEMRINGRYNLINNFTCSVSINKYIEQIKNL